MRRANDMKNDGGPAFPQPCTSEGHPGNVCYGVAGGGLSLRDYFAAKAISRIPFGEYETERIAKIAYETADAMLAEREK